MTYDLAILGDPENDSPSLAIDNTAASGVYKLVQKVMLLLLTDSSAENNIGEVGTSIPQLLQGANVPEPEVVSNIFAAALAEIKPTIISGITTDTPADEIPTNLKAFVVTDENNEKDVVAVEILVSTQAEENVSVRVPISTISTDE
jgi:hypothetical protein